VLVVVAVPETVFKHVLKVYLTEKLLSWYFFNIKLSWKILFSWVCMWEGKEYNI
jgi:hypothetical protein